MQKLFQGTANKAPLTQKEASVYLGFAVETLKKWRRQNKGPVYTIFNNRPYYQKEDLDKFLDSCFCPPTKEN